MGGNLVSVNSLAHASKTIFEGFLDEESHSIRKTNYPELDDERYTLFLKTYNQARNRSKHFDKPKDNLLKNAIDLTNSLVLSVLIDSSFMALNSEHVNELIKNFCIWFSFNYFTDSPFKEEELFKEGWTKEDISLLKTNGYMKYYLEQLI